MLALAGLFFDFFAGLLHVLARARHGVAGSDETGRERNQQQQENQTLHTFLLTVCRVVRLSDWALASSAPPHLTRIRMNFLWRWAAEPDRPFRGGRAAVVLRAQKAQRPDCSGPCGVPCNQRQLLALSSTFSPSFFTSLPRPSMVLQADRVAIENRASIATAITRFIGFSGTGFEKGRHSARAHGVATGGAAQGGVVTARNSIQVPASRASGSTCRTGSPPGRPRLRRSGCGYRSPG